VVHLQPARWVNDWLVIGEDKDGDGCGDAVAQWKKPNLPSSGEFQPAEDDEFDSPELGLQWQFEGPYSHYWYFCDANKSKLRLYGVQRPDGFKNLSDLQNALLQKFPTENFTATAKMQFIPNPEYKDKGEEGGFIIKGQDYAALKIVSISDGCELRYVTCADAMKGKAENIEKRVELKMSKMKAPYTQKYAVDDIPQPRMATQDVYVRVTVKSEGTGNAIKSKAQFYYSFDGKKYKKIGDEFTVKEGRWIGAKLGFYNSRPGVKNDGAFLDIDWIRFEK
jgi:hypothetical protein